MGVYKWKTRVGVLIDPQIAGERLESIRLANGGEILPALVVEDARPSGSPLHSAFEWNDTVAAEKHREDQARYLIRSIVVVTQVDNQLATPLRAFVHLDDRGSYTSTVAAMSDRDLREKLLERAWRELGNWKRRYRNLADFAKLISAIEDAEALNQGERLRAG